MIVEELLLYYLTHYSGRDKGVLSFPEVICPKMNVIA